MNTGGTLAMVAIESGPKAQGSHRCVSVSRLPEQGRRLIPEASQSLFRPVSPHGNPQTGFRTVPRILLSFLLRPTNTTLSESLHSYQYECKYEYEYGMIEL